MTLIYCNTRVVSRGELLYNMLSPFLQKGVMVIIVSTAVNVQDQVLEEALALEHNVLELRPQGHPDRATSLANLANSLHSRFQQLGTLSDLEEALALQCNVLELCPQGHPDRATSLADVMNSLHSCFQQLGILSDLEEALALHCNVLELHPQGHPDRATSLINLAHSLHSCFKQSTMCDMSDLEEIFNLYSQLSDVSQTVSLADLKCAKQWNQVSEECGHITTVLVYQTFLHFSVQHFGTLLSLPQHLALLKQLMASTAIDTFSACVRFGNPPNAVELLEQGCGIFWS